MIEKTVAELSAALAAGDISSVELTQTYLNRIGQLNSELNAFITVCEDSAMQQANAADTARAGGDSGALLGIPIAHKDIFCTEGVLTTCGSRMLHNFVSPYNATVVERLNSAGVVTLGKTNMDEFAMGSSNETSFFGDVRNPWDTKRVPGGSSGGSAAAVAADLCAMATGTDTGGSIRQPAAFCGITGFKPSYGRVSRWGMVAFASSLDQAGPLTKSAEDAALMLNAIAGLDEKDSTSIDTPTDDYTAGLNNSLEGLKIGIPRQHFAEGLNSEVEQSIRDALKEYEKLGATIKEIDLPNNHLSVSAYYVVAPAEASANLSRFDGVRYGYRCEDPVDLEDMYKRSRSEGFGDEVKRRILVGTYALSAGFYDAYYRKAQKIRRLIKNDFDEAFKEVDVIIGPTSPHTAFELGSKSDPVAMYLEDIYTIAVNLAGLPGISVPAGLVDGLPIGMHMVTNDFEESKLLNIAHKFQQSTDWHTRKPAIKTEEA
ncbi:MAG: Asp-tRNA(Asn)/Glu-tRNA(Gln) amidotransferase subunit GatA [Gammaproteobacteria bacterium]|jgi:aspartyl-tRNA(Asn)/glutamyl-tRNA(Gln) amidotransferase subunit A|nr:Asp-tRNA(Asn)/Glu-tRNA(Gln) amidotransferase subunit GatA [Gammaproteobacteria bacterium]MBT3859749.1 Asp-tRNA(Asn)/Glu-tRNA(Gln) amidotransferase subunit GatA [Gammaproteobacteria bacterium]MBT3987270.1 Asp-tRNA(Asn)/Glu-tRNA(Gln) amidotransferase subunit GatA [Gammaproteobacteria bacterium]MBT4254542.1 Asp-tRNA(Asn)/Glu-tRNA(Gln) amidotransferase subunit GatA [Gammaproteobacteria bacterium]MBT4582274.1 Asp-tRNA(Asn)/Glu-tRNA(Gln) amidotransferase subunit GatA [Gammaproteobacteria bacterium